MPRLSNRLRPQLPRRERLRTRELEEMFYFLEDLRVFMREELEERKKEDAAKEAAAKGKESVFAKKFTFMQTVGTAWFVSLPLSLLWLKLMWPWFN